MKRAPLPLLGAVGLVMIALVAVSAGSQVPARVTPEPPRRFEHRDHVRAQWKDPADHESPRDCRGCHRFEQTPAGEAPVDLASGCVQCHHRGLLSVESVGAERPREFPHGFLHVEHDTLACRECHSDEGRQVGSRMPVPHGTGFCAECHGPGDEDEAKFLTGVNERPSMQADQLGPFLHREHLSAPADPEADCTSCHAGLAVRSDAPHTIGPGLELEQCSSCHEGTAGVALRFRFDLTPRPSRSAGTFQHADHLDHHSCAACHGYDPAESTGPAAFRFLPRGSGASVTEYAGCADCHEDWAVPHEDWEDRRCTECHVFGGGDMRIDRPTIEVRRAASSEYSLSRHAHPFITKQIPEGSSEAAVAEFYEQNCRQCHRSRLDDLPTRSTAVWSLFDHDVHLGPSPGSDDCRRCHTDARVASTSGPASLGGEGEEFARSYALEACSSCHGGEFERRPVAGGNGIAPAAVTRRVVQFPHDAHMGVLWNDRAMECTTCHVAVAGGMGHASGVESCVLCHDHDEAADHTPGPPIEAGEVSRCVHCHHDSTGLVSTASIPALGPVEPSPARSWELLGVDGATVHSGGRACSDCHAPIHELRREPARFTVASDVLRRRNSTLHTLDQQQGTDRSNCLGCHWTAVGDPQFGPPRPAFEAEEALRGYPGFGSFLPRRR